MTKKKVLNKPPSPVQLGMKAMPSWFHPPTLIPVDKKHIKLIELGINTKLTDERGLPIRKL
jgi:hypothetical protein